MNGSIYIAGVFRTLSTSPIGQELWSFLNEDVMRVRLRTASDLGRPALEAVEEPLLERFGADVLDDRVKQMIGHMTRQVMEQEGYIVDAQNVKVTGGAPFSRATRYRRRDAMVFHVWRLASDLQAVAITNNKTGQGLPGEGTKEWQYWKSFDGPLRARIGLGLTDIARAKAEIETTGCFRHRLTRVLRAANSTESQENGTDWNAPIDGSAAFE